MTTSEACHDYVGFLRPDAPCHNCGAPCIEHQLPLEDAVRMGAWDTDEEREQLRGVNDRP